MVLRPVTALCTAAVLLASCGDSIKTKEKVQAAIVDRVQSRAGLDLKSMDVSTTSLSFEKNMAYATVAFHPKGDTTIHSGMEMKYTLEDRDGKWVVVKVANANGSVFGGQPSNGAPLPPGHPSVQPGAPKDQMGVPNNSGNGAIGAHQGAGGQNR
jgi:hypothetical protein